MKILFFALFFPVALKAATCENVIDQHSFKTYRLFRFAEILNLELIDPLLTPIGHISYTVNEDATVIHIADCESHPSQNGTATKLFAELARQYPHAAIEGTLEAVNRREFFKSKAPTPEKRFIQTPLGKILSRLGFNKVGIKTADSSERVPLVFRTSRVPGLSF